MREGSPVEHLQSECRTDGKQPGRREVEEQPPPPRLTAPRRAADVRLAGDPAALRREIDCVLESAELVDETDRVRLLARVDAAVRERPHLRRVHLAATGDGIDELG